MQPSRPASTAAVAPRAFVSALPGGMSSVQSARAANARSGTLCPKASIPARSSRSRALVGTGVATAVVEIVAAQTIGSAVAAVRIAGPVGVPRHGLELADGSGSLESSSIEVGD